MRPSVVLDMKRSAVREAVGRFRAANPRVFGSVLHGTDRDGSDLDLLVDAVRWWARRQQPTRSSATARPHDQPPVQIRVRTHIQPVWGHCERGISDDC
jgi:hypothetical protein